MDLTKDFSEFVDKARTVLDSIDSCVGEGIQLEDSVDYTKKHVKSLMFAVITGLASIEILAKVGTLYKKEVEDA